MRWGLAVGRSSADLLTSSGPYSGSKYSDPYRLYNVDIFEYDHDSAMSLYGAIPLLHAQAAIHSVGLLSLAASETWVDVLKPSSGVQTHWMTESGIMDLFILPGPDPAALFRQYAALTGPTPLPPLWSLGYHQCRWNYWSTEDVLEVDRRFDEEDIPLDVTWLDIEYAEEHRYFDWNKKEFPEPVQMLDAVGAKGRKVGGHRFAREQGSQAIPVPLLDGGHRRSAHQEDRLVPDLFGRRARQSVDQEAGRQRLRRLVLDRIKRLGRLFQAAKLVLVEEDVQV